MKIGIIGLGLMGASAGKLMISKGHTVYGVDHDKAVQSKALRIKAIDGILTVQMLKEIDLLIYAAYPRDFLASTRDCVLYMKDGAIVTDFCGDKRIVLEGMRKLEKRYPNLVYIGAHPMAGKEYSGIEHSSARLFDGASIILVPLLPDCAAVSKLKDFYLSLGFGDVVVTDADNHDGMIAFTSQLCHIVSNAYIKSDSAIRHAGYSAGSYKDLTRVARLSADMWAPLMIDNRDKLSGELENLINNLNDYLSALKTADEQKLNKLLKDGNDRKVSIDSKVK